MEMASPNLSDFKLGLYGHNQKFEVNISYGGSAIEFFLHKCLTGGVESSRVVEILTIIMLTPTGRIGLGYGFGVEQLKLPLY